MTGARSTSAEQMLAIWLAMLAACEAGDAKLAASRRAEFNRAYGTQSHWAEQGRFHELLAQDHRRWAEGGDA